MNTCASASNTAIAAENPGSEDTEELARICELTPERKRFADLLFEGANQTQAYRFIFPHVEDGPSLRAAASKLARNKRIKTYLGMRSGQRVDGPRIGDPEEALKLLWETARGRDSSARIRALEVIHRINQAERERAVAPAMGVIDLLDRMASTAGEFGTCLAMSLAVKHKVPWRPKLPPDFAPPQAPLTEEDLSRQAYLNEIVVTPGAAARERFITELNAPELDGRSVSSSAPESAGVGPDGADSLGGRRRQPVSSQT